MISINNDSDTLNKTNKVPADIVSIESNSNSPYFSIIEIIDIIFENI